MTHTPNAARRTKALRPSLQLATAAAALLALAACATTPSPTEALQAASLAIANAEQARAAQYAPAELGQARDELAAARTAFQQEQMGVAKRLAEQSRAGAELASAKTAAAKARAVNDDTRESTEAIKQEMQRNPGAN